MPASQSDKPVSAGKKTPASAPPAAERDVQFLPGVGSKLAALLKQKLDIHTLTDLWFHLPRAYEDRTRIVPIGSAVHGESAQFEGTVIHAEITFKGRRALQAVLEDGSGRIRLKFFYFQNAQLERFKDRPRVRAFGEAREQGFGFEIVHPKVSFLHDTDITPVSETLSPIYPKTQDINNDRLSKIVRHALAELPPAHELELMPAPVLQHLQWSELRAALMLVHSPPPDVDMRALMDMRHPAQQRLAGEELLAHQLSMRIQRQTFKAERGRVLAPKGVLAKKLLATLGFTLTGAQQRVSGEIALDLKQAEPMLRLVQGDVGSGKTVVAALAAAAAIECQTQVALVAPTELLAEQHYRNFQRWFAAVDATIDVVWLAGKVKGKAREAAMQRIASGAAIVIGTHALFSEAVRFKALALCIIDEQHRFGVQQRLSLREKGVDPANRTQSYVPHQLVMTATPIPRTLAMVGFADLDVSVIDELPPSRKPVQTVVINGERREELIARIETALNAGRQAYWVCTLIEENDTLQAQAAQASYQRLCEALPLARIGLVHGRLKAKEKEALMQQFSSGELQVLVATTVIEVGVDVPNASLMLIENAERLGLSQLHQLRGRVGRGSAASSCVLMYQAPLSQHAKARLQILRESNDGFVIAEKDLELRGPGELLGTKQTGDMRFRIADLNRDQELLERVQAIAERFAQKYPEQSKALIRRWIGHSERYSQA